MTNKTLSWDREEDRIDIIKKDIAWIQYATNFELKESKESFCLICKVYLTWLISRVEELEKELKIKQRDCKHEIVLSKRVYHARICRLCGYIP